MYRWGRDNGASLARARLAGAHFHLGRSRAGAAARTSLVHCPAGRISFGQPRDAASTERRCTLVRVVVQAARSLAAALSEKGPTGIEPTRRGYVTLRVRFDTRGNGLFIFRRNVYNLR